MTYTYEQLYYYLVHSYLDARQAERNKDTQLLFESDFEQNLSDLCRSINERSYKPSPPICFLITDPTRREVFAPSFRDRIVSHLLFNSIAPIFEKTFIYDSYSCRVGKGTLFGIDRMKKFLISCSDNYKYLDETWVLSLDISGYFMSIHRPTLYNIVNEVLDKYKTKPVEKGSEITWEENIDYSLCKYLIDGILLRDPKQGCSILDPNNPEWKLLPPNKSLFNAPTDTGLPIGDLTSQLFSNVYLNKFDQFMKRELGCEYYGRYVDDSRVISRDLEFLKSIIPLADQFLHDELRLSLHPKKIQIQPAKYGIRFLGQIVKPYRTYISNRAIRAFKNAAWKIMQKEDPSQVSDRDLAVVNSYLGFLQHVDEKKITRKIISKFGLNHALDFENDLSKAIKKT